MVLHSCSSAVLAAPLGYSGLSGQARMKRLHHSSGRSRRQSEVCREGNRVWPQHCRWYGPLVLAAGDAHMAADAGPIVPPVDDEVVALRFQPDGAVDGDAE